eukprot:TRINITY_DN728_c0_g1_i1.p1 TRINITY_DN728_c0_g1~~TRINITY_DN728_c0_g1_i1.p1  ORF type:complete len:368 (+),score=79.21 TRINITY_DN728_c0_g1_i1:961-2064(+)
MLILGVTNPQGVKKYVAAAFPSACGKTNLAMLLPKLPGWKVECVGDDICWMKYGKDGRLYAINPEAGFFGVAPGTSMTTNPIAMETIKSNAIFTNVAMTPDGDIWWEGMTSEQPESLKSWLRKDWHPGCGEEAAHPNSRFTVPARQCPIIDSNWESTEGVPIDAIIFGGRRSSVVPLVYQAFNWQHGTFVGAVMNSETTAAAAGKRGVLRPDPFAMKPFIGYHVGDYFNHWLSVGKNAPDPKKLPKIFHVNWFRKNAKGGFMWPGYRENARVLKWIFDRTGNNGEASVGAKETPIGYVPDVDALDVEGLDISKDTMQELLRIDSSEWLSEVTRYEDFLNSVGSKLPAALRQELDGLRSRLNATKTSL